MALTQVGIPSKYAFALYLMLRFAPIIASESAQIRQAQRARVPRRRLSLDEFILIRRYLLALVGLVVRRAEQTALAMDARGFSREGLRTCLVSPGWSLRGPLLLVAVGAVQWWLVLFLNVD